MKKYILILTMALLGAGLVSCESLRLGDAGLSKAPETSGATLDTLFSTLKDSDKVLANAYSYLPYGIICDFDRKMGNDILESITDHYISNKHSDGNGPNDLYYNGGLGANISGGGEAYRFGGYGTKKDREYYAIRYALTYLENADKIPDANPTELARKKAEAKVILAISYAQMLRFIGGVPILRKSIDMDDDMHYPRETFEKTVDYIVQMCDEAAPDLPWYVSASEDGRMTKAAALGLKLRILCFAASPTFNSDTPWHPKADEYVCYGNYDAGRWQKAKAAAKEFMDAWAANGWYALVQAEPDPVLGITPRSYRLAYRKGYYERGTTESIISVRKSNSTSYHEKQMDLQDDFGCGASLDWVNKFPFADGTPFPEDFDWENPASWPQKPFFKPDPTGTLVVGSSHFTETRDPRLYENICVPGDIWKDGKVGKAYDNHEHHQDGCPGFLMMKFILQQTTDRSTPPHWPLMRLSEVLLNAAEAYNEADGGPGAEAYGWLDAVRGRVGLPGATPDMTKEQFRDALILERELEFGFEEVRWFDMVRWGLTKAFTTKLRGLTSIGDKAREATSFTFKEKVAYPPRLWYTDWDTKWYMAPIPAAEINKKYGMTQNPGW